MSAVLKKKDTPRSFVIKSVDDEDYTRKSRYVGFVPLQIAKKVARRVFDLYPNKNKLVFEMRESTSGKPKKVFKYEAKRGKKLAQPKTVDFKGVKITYKREPASVKSFTPNEA